MNLFTADNNRTRIREFSSISSLMRFLTDTPDNNVQHEKESHSSNKHFTLTRSYDEALNLLSNGWTEAAEKMTKALDAIPFPTPTTTPRPTYSVQGHTPSVPRYLQGIPTNMVTSRATPSPRPIIHITHGITYSAMWGAEDILKEGIKCLEIIRSLEARQYSVRFSILCAADDDRSITGFKVCIKEPSERLNMAKMSFPLAHPSMLRRFFFRYIEVTPDLPNHYYAYGTPISDRKVHQLYPKDVYIPAEVDKERALTQAIQQDKK
jgi:hypothetical protein